MFNSDQRLFKYSTTIKFGLFAIIRINVHISTRNTVHNVILFFLMLPPTPRNRHPHDALLQKSRGWSPGGNHQHRQSLPRYSREHPVEGILGAREDGILLMQFYLLFLVQLHWGQTRKRAEQCQAGHRNIGSLKDL